MPGTLTTYKVFIASAGGLDEFRSAFREIVEHYNSTEAYHRGYMFMPVGWEDTTTGCGRPQALINEDLKQCDFSLFMFRNRWGTPPSVNGPHSSGTEEEWELATEMRRQGSMRDIQGCFFPFLPCNTPEEMAQRTRVEAFKQKLENERQFFFKSLRQESDFRDWLRAQLSQWLRLIEQEARQREEAKRQFLTQERSASTSKPQSGDGVLALVHHELMELLNTDQYSAALSLANVLLKLAQTPGDTAEALLIKGFIHGQLSQHADAFAAYDELLHRFADAPDPALRELVAQALFNKGEAQSQLQQPEAAIATYDELLRRFTDAPEPALRFQVAMTLFNKGITQGNLNQFEAAIATFDRAVHRFCKDTEPRLREAVAMTLVNKGFAQDQTKQREAAIETYDEVVSRFGKDTGPILSEAVAKALVSKGRAQGRLNQSEAEVGTYNDVIRRFGEVSEPALRDQVATALNGRGFARLMQAKAMGLQNALSTEHLRTALMDFNQAAEKSTQPSGTVLGNRAYVQQLLGSALQAEADFAAALLAPKDGGQALYEATLKDLDMHPIPEDQAMRELVEKAWVAYQDGQGNVSKAPPAAPPPH